jgi:hypothetical protein
MCSTGQLPRQVLERDGWRCQVCGSMQNLQVHHLRFRSHSGGDEEQNLITLCALAGIHSPRSAADRPICATWWHNPSLTFEQESWKPN